MRAQFRPPEIVSSPFARPVLTASTPPGRIAEKLDRFELISELASGGMATVYLARLSGVGGFQRLYAIKRLHPHLARDGEFIEMFLDEARLAARIHHPNVVPILEIGESERGHHLVMEYIEGDTAARLFARASHQGKRLPPAVGIRILLDALAGLHAAHELKDDEGKPLDIVHRDVSPQNILVGVDGIARITDFGVARASSRLSTTRSGQLKGKLAYMAPEQARAGKIDRRADVFAMGIVLWETLAFRRLFKGDAEADTLNRVLYQPIPTLQSAAPTVPSALNDVCMKALERDPDKRFASAAELADALEKAAQSLKLLGTSRDVAAAVERTMGAELAQQREAVRAWTARSEPTAGSVPPPPTSVTRVEGNATSKTPPAVTSVSSSVLSVPPPPSTGQVTALAAADAPTDAARAEPAPAVKRPRHRARAWAIAAALAGTAIVITAATMGRAHRGALPTVVQAWASRGASASNASPGASPSASSNAARATSDAKGAARIEGAAIAASTPAAPRAHADEPAIVAADRRAPGAGDAPGAATTTDAAAGATTSGTRAAPGGGANEARGAAAHAARRRAVTGGANAASAPTNAPSDAPTPARAAAPSGADRGAAGAPSPAAPAIPDDLANNPYR